ncbi:unnamed protein product [Oppiella nova]|uniref:C2H2-type domain-containing protein n=1 Tax=Oppiella nova TaxID=334625 RepID=A0A7R9LM11_9ACAR|nr:unnamed protein product [Oppiella nova]CAG2164932.1 unnamed protein product [Oppiella nova]
MASKTSKKTAENQRLLNELLFANQLKTLLFEIHTKYETIISSEDKQAFNELLKTMEVKTSEDNHSSEPTNRHKLKKSQSLRPLQEVIRTLHKYGEDSGESGVQIDPTLAARRSVRNRQKRQSLNHESKDKTLRLLRQSSSERDMCYDMITKSYICPQSDCQMSFKTDSKFTHHLRTTHTGITYSCDYENCEYVCANKNSLKSHVVSHENQTTQHHRDVRKELDSKCYDPITKSYVCCHDECHKSFKNYRRFRAHYISVHTSASISCDYIGCNHVFKTNHSMRIHYKTYHTNVVPIKCGYNDCTYETVHKAYMRHHRENHSTATPYVCDFEGCLKAFKSKVVFRAHMRTHNPEPTYKCSVDGCGQKFHKQHDVVKHQKYSHNIVKLKPMKSCEWPGCCYKARTMELIKDHRRTHTGEKPFQCNWPECGKWFRTTKTLREHSPFSPHMRGNRHFYEVFNQLIQCVTKRVKKFSDNPMAKQTKITAFFTTVSDNGIDSSDRQLSHKPNHKLIAQQSGQKRKVTPNEEVVINGVKRDTGRTKFARSGPKICPFYKKIPNTRFVVDAFSYGSVPGIEIYFLTHFHSDHYVGLKNSFTHEICCSPITALLVRNHFKSAVFRVNVIEVNETREVLGTRVTFLEANHCPGAVVILFELTNGYRYLHTGDFRADHSFFAYKQLICRPIDTIFLDTTYCDPKYDFLPQKDILKTIVSISICGTYSIGKENVFIAIASALNLKSHIDINQEFTYWA